MKVFLNITTKIGYDKLMHLVRQFEQHGFEVVDTSPKFAGRWITSVPIEELGKADFVIVINEMLFFHQSFWKKVKGFLSLGVECFGCERVLYVNNSMGLIDTMEENNPRIVILHKDLVVGDILKAMDDFRELYDEKPLVASVVDDVEFIGKSGKFHAEFLTANHLNNGNW